MTKPANVFRQNEWVHIAAAWSVFTRRVTLFINGRLVDEAMTDEALNVAAVGETFSVGNRGPFPIEGVIDEIAISDHCLGADEILAEFRRPIADYRDPM